MISQTYSTKQFELSTSKAFNPTAFLLIGGLDAHTRKKKLLCAVEPPVEQLFKEAKIMTLNEIIKSENCLLALHQMSAFKCKKFTDN